MATETKPQISPTMLAAFLAGAGLTAGTQIIIKPPDPSQGPGWDCRVQNDEQVLCRPGDTVFIPPEDLIVRIDSPDAGTPDAGTPAFDAGEK